MTGIEDVTVKSNTAQAMEIPDSKDHPIGNVLKKNDELIHDWTRTNKTRDELKLLQAAAATQEKKRVL